jgi:hypothetical protein
MPGANCGGNREVKNNNRFYSHSLVLSLIPASYLLICFISRLILRTINDIFCKNFFHCKFNSSLRREIAEHPRVIYPGIHHLMQKEYAPTPKNNKIFPGDTHRETNCIRQVPAYGW